MDNTGMNTQLTPFLQDRLIQRFLLSVLTIVLINQVSPDPGDAASTTRILPDGSGIELKVDGANGQYTDILPLHEVKGVPYFSAGVGLEEREAAYPPYSLKLEFLIKGGAYTGFVDLTVKGGADPLELHIPKEHTKGPWLFVDLPPGTYSITGMRNTVAQTRHSIEVVSGRVTTVHLIWDE